jgi:choline transport protein
VTTALPFSNLLAKVHPTLQVPANATIACTVLSILYGLTYIASTTAFSSIISMAILSLNFTYVIPEAIVLLRGRSKMRPKRHFDLGSYFGP